MAALLLGSVSAAHAQGALDPTFGDGGIAIVPQDAFFSVVRGGVLVAPDGGVTAVLQDRVVAGGADATLVRLRPDGSRDASFGEDGVLRPATGFRASAAAGLVDGRLLLGGRLEDEPALVRLLADGSPDPSFGDQGVLRGRTAADLEILPDGRILAADVGVWRLLPDGSPDPSFGDGGFADLPDPPIGNGGSRATAVAVAAQPSGGVLVAMNLEAAIVTAGLLTRFTADGDWDSSYGGDGIVDVGSTAVRDLVAAGDGAALVLDRFAVARFDASGRRDPSYAPPIDGSGSGTAAILIDGKERLVASGSRLVQSAGGDRHVVLLQRFLADGEPDPAFGGATGLVVDPPGFGAQGTGFEAVSLASDGRIVAAGSVCAAPNRCDLLVVRVAGERMSGVQLSPDGLRQMVVKDVGAERWSIVRNLDDGTVTGNVYVAGQEPQFLWCSPSPGPTPPETVALDCFAAPPCVVAPCGNFAPAGHVELPEAFFLPPDAGGAPGS
ncbi:MAG TPA: hypothetical protein VIS07_04670 [Candidatus Binatia bacterium]